MPDTGCTTPPSWSRSTVSPLWNYLDGGAGETLDDNRSAFARWRFRPRILTGMGEPSATTFLGAELALPLLTASFGSDALFDPEGDRAVARENACHGIAAIGPRLLQPAHGRKGA